MDLQQAGTLAVVKERALYRHQSIFRNTGARTKDKVYFLDIFVQEVVVATDS
jgi:hypothetical protein